MDGVSLAKFAANSLEFASVRRTLEKLHDDYQQPQELLLVLGWLVARGRAPAQTTINALYGVAQRWDEQRCAPLRRRLQESLDAGAHEACSQLREALAVCQGRLLEQLETLALRENFLEESAPSLTLEEVLLRAMPKISFCQGQSELLDLLVDRWELNECLR